MKKWKIIPASFLLLLFGFLAFDLQTYFLSPDEKDFVTGFDRFSGIEGVDGRYKIWALVVSNLYSIHTGLPLIFNAVLLLLSINNSILKKDYNRIFLAFVIFLPSSLYLLTSYLRDVVFLIFSIFLIGRLSLKRDRGQSNFWVLFGTFCIIAPIRPAYSLIYLTSYLAMSLNRRWRSALLAAPILVWVSMLFSLSIFEPAQSFYKEFFLQGHASGRDAYGMTDVAVGQQGSFYLLENLFLSPLYFWVIPPQGTGRLLDNLLLLEGVVITLCLFFFIRRVFRRLYYQDDVFFFCAFIISVTILFSCFVTTHQDVLRFRVAFTPFLLYVGASGYLLTFRHRLPLKTD